MLESIIIEKFGPLDELNWQNHHALNVIVGENGTGKTQLLKLMYAAIKSLDNYRKQPEGSKHNWSELLAEKLSWTFLPPRLKLGELVSKGGSRLAVDLKLNFQSYHFAFGTDTTSLIRDCNKLVTATDANTIFFPPKEVLTTLDIIYESRKGQKPILGYDDTYFDLVELLLLPSVSGRIQLDLLSGRNRLDNILGGKIEKSDDEFIYTAQKKTFTMSQTAEGVKKIGILRHLLNNRSINRNTILFIDEPEDNLHPDAIIKLMDVLFDFTKLGVQVYIATHSYFVIKKIEMLARQTNTSVSFCSLNKVENEAGAFQGINAETGDMDQGLPENRIVDVSVKLFEEDIRIDLED
ncbi:ATP-binding protein [bacterium]|nr:ATP-binding protein [bacterium]